MMALPLNPIAPTKANARPGQTRSGVAGGSIMECWGGQKGLDYRRLETGHGGSLYLQHRQIMSNRVMDQQTHDARLTNLEIKLSFTEDMVEELNKTLFRQQEQIDLLIREVDKLRQQSTDETTTASRSAADDFPPHY